MADQSDGADHPTLRKLAVWRSHVRGAPLPDDFFDHPPLIHPMGRSYAALAGRDDGQHVSERPPSGPLGTTTDATRLALVQGHTRIVGERWVLLPARPGHLSAISRATFDRRLAAHGQRYLGCEAVSARCLTPAPRPWTPWMIGLGVMVTAVTGAASVVQARRERTRAHIDRTFVLRTLTHELRTPATAIGLELDRVRQHFDALPNDGQDAFLGLVSANQRLRRTLDATATFLTVDQGGAPVQPASVAVASLLDDADVTVHGDATLHTDPAWLTVALGNLVANAHAHGEAPVVVHIAANSTGATICVEDAGTLDSSLDALCRPFERGTHSAGLGLGLALTQRIAQMLGGRLTLRHRPTRFTLHLDHLP